MKAPRPRETIHAAEYRQQIGGIEPRRNKAPD